jgi:hypothetical protein
MVLALSVMMTVVANLARFGVIAPILMHAVFNSQRDYLGGLFHDAIPGSGGFLPILARHWHVNISMSFTALVVIEDGQERQWSHQLRDAWGSGPERVSSDVPDRS